MHINFKADSPPAKQISFDDFLKVDIRIGKIISAKNFEKAKKPAYILEIDFGETLGVRKSSAQITKNYSCQDLVNKHIAAVINFPPRQIGPLMSEVLTLGFADENGNIVLFSPDKNVPLGSRLL